MLKYAAMTSKQNYQYVWHNSYLIHNALPRLTMILRACAYETKKNSMDYNNQQKEREMACNKLGKLYAYDRYAGTLKVKANDMPIY